jgi:hypothetical protein
VSLHADGERCTVSADKLKSQQPPSLHQRHLIRRRTLIITKECLD